MTAAMPLWQVPDPAGPGFGMRLADVSAAVSSLAATADGLADVADDDVLTVMDELTSLVARIDGLRVATAAAVRDRDLVRRRGARNLASWLRADPRIADDAWKISQLAAAGHRLPRIRSLLCSGQISLAQAGAAYWQVSHLPNIPARPEEAPDPPGSDGGSGADAGDSPDTRGPDGPDTRAGDSPDTRGSDGSGVGAGDCSGTGVPDSSGTAGCPGSDHGPGNAASGAPGDRDMTPPRHSDPDEAWAGLWRAGDVHAAADELFSQYLPSLDASQVRALGAHLREAADAQERAAEVYDDYAKRRLRITRTLGNTAEITGRLHPEAAEQVIAAFEDLAVKHGPDDARTKDQRWADALARLAAGAPISAPSAGTMPSGPPDESGDDQPGPEGQHTHGHPSLEEHPGLEDAAPGSAIPPGFRKPRIIVTVPLTALLGRPLAPGGILGPGTPITGQAARRLACDAEIIRIVTSSPPTCICSCGHRHRPGQDGGGGQISHDPDTTSPAATGQDATGRYPTGPGTVGLDTDGPDLGLNTTGQLTRLLANAIAALPHPLSGPSAILDAGRKHPGWTPRQRDALYAQYGGRCSAPGCNGPIDVIHHIIHWTEGGPTRIANGAPVCNYHHWLVHEGGWRMRKHPGGRIVLIPPPPGWRPGIIYRRGKPIRAG
ncbi:MAG TPA: HNH endonuclease signature motif containing protein [Streptosporangiaceae bacterium]